MDEDFTISTDDTTRPGTVRVAAAGAVDMLTGPALRDHLDSACRSAPPGGTVIADLRCVSFLGATGLDVLARTREQARHLGVGLRVVADQPAVLRPMRRTMLDHVIPVSRSAGRT